MGGGVLQSLNLYRVTQPVYVYCLGDSQRISLVSKLKHLIKDLEVQSKVHMKEKFLADLRWSSWSIDWLIEGWLFQGLIDLSELFQELIDFSFH